MKKATWRAVVLLGAIALGAWLHSCFPPDIGVVVLQNGSGRDIARAVVRIREIELVFPKIPDGGFSAARYEIPGDAHYEVLVTFDSGKTLRLESGYVTSGMDAFDVMVVREDEIIHQASEGPGLSASRNAP
ncbi:hypothetical protein [Pseudodesulfovibrio sp.]|uniref:hypothetical protein n=1 Tax=Pseudodesulfovibrio sp. TaxID=2035812 RepID=UPI002639656C|nr:hypothetical protein [Pseudodesulfovibrio sp.]MDD3313875.1 hypothetical protein [Pseudodesulfovibrio sp.]